MVPSRGGGGNLPRLTSLRFFAALLILIYHARLSDLVPGGRVFDVAHMGVAFFFVLSGFVLTWASPGERIEPRRFWLNRFARIYPSHLVTMLIAAVIFLPVRWTDVLLHLFLLQAWAPHQSTILSLNEVSWSLSAEAFFYLLAPWLITALRRRSDRTMVILALGWWIVTMGAGRALILMGFEEWPYYLPAIRSAEFIIGIVLAELFRRGRLSRRIPVWPCVVACLVSYGAALAVYRMGVTMQMMPAIITAPAICLLVVAAAQADARGQGGLLTSPLLEHAGKVSFAVYLVHALVLTVVPPLLPEPATLAWQLAGLAVVLVVTWACAEALHRGVELPAQRAIRSRFARRIGAAARH
ncbi:acyltransferase [Actinomyces slackii]|uniref:Uncharacterized protein conserved in bacteria n=1 Tax=Actinomyces slackii TaxID=52774 RepID=A0A3S4SRS7_9ACTO|nr:acyltransferase [Actinomyces slackii]VEG73490.1 Uncharacterized protein conserved in bacteria [Actinomyces slackii]